MHTVVLITVLMVALLLLGQFHQAEIAVQQIFVLVQQVQALVPEQQ